MVESIMFFAGGFLVAALLALILISFVHHRAVRLTQRRLEGAIPVSMAEIAADRDGLRAGFAMSARRLEMSVEQLNAKVATQLGEIAHKTEAINRLKAELAEKTAVTDALEATAKTLSGKIGDTERDCEVKTAALEASERALALKEAELAKTAAGLNEQRVAADTQGVEIAVLKTQVEQFKARIDDLEREAQDAARLLSEERIAAGTIAKELTEKRRAVETLRPRAARLEGEVAAHTEELENRARRIADLESRNGDQARTLAERGAAYEELRRERDAEVDALRQQHDKEVAALRQQIGADRAEHSFHVGRLQEEKSGLERVLADTRDTVASHAGRIGDLEKSLAERDVEVKTLENAFAFARRESDAATERLQADKHSLERLLQTVNHTLETRAGRISDLESWMAERDELLGRRDAEIKALLGELSAFRERDEAAAALRVEKETAQLEARLKGAIEDRREAQQELAALRHEADATWKTERDENALLRERIGDIAAQVVHMAITKEAGGDTIKASEAIEAIEASLSRSSRGESQAEAIDHATARPNGDDRAPVAGELITRIRKLQSAGSEAPGPARPGAGRRKRSAGAADNAP